MSKRKDETFINMARKHFDFLITAYKYRYRKKEIRKQYQYVKYIGKDFEVEVSLDTYGCGVSLVFILIQGVDKYTSKKNKGIEWDLPQYGLDFIIEHFRKDNPIKMLSFDEMCDDKLVDKHLEEIAAFVKEYCSDLLNGDLSILPTLDKMIAKNAEILEKKYYDEYKEALDNQEP